MAQPLYDLLDQYPTFLTAHGVGAGGVRWLVVVLSFLAPGSIAVLLWGVGTLSDATRRALHLACIFCLIALIALPVVGHLTGLPDAAVFAVAMGAALATSWVYATRGAAQSFITLLSPAILVFPGVFLFTEPIARIAFPSSTERHATSAPPSQHPPIVMVVFDELPLTALTDARGEIEAARLPGFARLAESSHWFRNASTVHSRTTIAVPALMTGQRPKLVAGKPRPPTVHDYPSNLFLLLAGAYEIFAYEPVTALCPQNLCRSLGPENATARPLGSDLGIVFLQRVLPSKARSRLPTTERGWAGFANDEALQRKPLDAPTLFRAESQRGRDVAFKELIQSISSYEIPPFYFLHTMLPHASYDYLPSGKRYYHRAVEKKIKTAHPVSGSLTRSAETWIDDPVRAAITYDHFLLQVGYVDTLIGRLIDALEAAGVYDEVLLVVTADHGVTIRPGEMRRELTPTNYKDILGVPLFVKLPGQSKGVIDDRNIELIDVVPTILETIGIEPPAMLDGIAIFDHGQPRADHKAAYMAGAIHEFPAMLEPFRNYAGIPPRQPRPWRATVIPGRLERALLGRDPIPHRAGVASPNEWLVEIVGADQYRQVDLAAPILPAQVVGRVIHAASDTTASQSDSILLAISLNGEIAALTRTFQEDDNPYFFSTMLPESGLRSGRNDLEVFIVMSGAESGPRLIQIMKIRLPQ